MNKPTLTIRIREFASQAVRALLLLATFMQAAARRHAQAEATRLDVARRVMLAGLMMHANRIGRRDSRLLARLSAAGDLRDLVDLRFEYFDAICRYETELDARRKMGALDELLSSR